MTTFGLGQSKEVGLIKNQIREAILDGEIPNIRANALAFMMQKGIEMGLKIIQNIDERVLNSSLEQ